MNILRRRVAATPRPRRGHAAETGARRYYEALQADAKKELTRLFAHVGLRNPRAVAKSSSMKITSDDLRPSIASFVKVRREVAAISPGLAAQLADTSRAVFKTIYLAGNRTASFAKLEAE